MVGVYAVYLFIFTAQTLLKAIVRRHLSTDPVHMAECCGIGMDEIHEWREDAKIMVYKHERENLLLLKSRYEI